MTTTVTALMVRAYSPGVYEDLAGVVRERNDDASGLTSLTFDGDLDPSVVAQIRDRMTSRDDDDQARRADLATKRDAVVADPSLANVAALAVAEANYQLGEA